MNSQEAEKNDAVEFFQETRENIEKTQAFLAKSRVESEKYDACQKSSFHENQVTLAGSVAGGVAGAVVAVESLSIVSKVPYIGPSIATTLGTPLVFSSVVTGVITGSEIAQSSIDRHHDECVQKAKMEVRKNHGNLQAEAKKAEDLTYELCRYSEEKQTKITSDFTVIGATAGLVGPVYVGLPQLAIPGAIAGAIAGNRVGQNIIDSNQVGCLEKSKTAGQKVLDEHAQKTQSEEQQRITNAQAEATLAKALSPTASITGMMPPPMPASAATPPYLSAPPAPLPIARPAPAPVQVSPSYNSSNRRVGFKIGFKF